MSVVVSAVVTVDVDLYLSLKAGRYSININLRDTSWGLLHCIAGSPV